LFAEWFWFAEIFPGLDEQSVEFVEAFYLRREVRLEKLLQLIVIRLRLNEVVADSDSCGVVIDDENLSVECVKQD